MRTAAEVNRDKAMDRVEAATDTEWRIGAEGAIIDLLENKPTGTYFTTDDILFRSPREPRAWGPVMTWGAREKLIEKTSMTRKSTDPKCNARPKTVWVTLVGHESSRP